MLSSLNLSSKKKISRKGMLKIVLSQSECTTYLIFKCLPFRQIFNRVI